MATSAWGSATTISTVERLRRTTSKSCCLFGLHAPRSVRGEHYAAPGQGARRRRDPGKRLRHGHAYRRRTRRDDRATAQPRQGTARAPDVVLVSSARRKPASFGHAILHGRSNRRHRHGGPCNASEVDDAHDAATAQVPDEVWAEFKADFGVGV